MSKPKKPKLLNIAGFAIPTDRWLKQVNTFRKKPRRKRKGENE